MRKRIVIALMLMLSVFVFVGCSSDDETQAPEDSKADVGPETIAEKWPKTVYIAAGMEDLNNQKLPEYLEEDLELVSIEVTVTVGTLGSKWKITETEGEKVYEVEYSNFESDAKDAKARFEVFVAAYNSGEAAEVDKEWDGGTLWLDGEKYKGRKVMQKIQKLLLGIAADPGVAAAPLQLGEGEAVIEKWKQPPVWEAVYVRGTIPGYLDAWLRSSSGLGSRGMTRVYLSKSTDADSEWTIVELQTGEGEDFNEKKWYPVVEEEKLYKIE